jgi:hypothetical protein
VAAENEGVNSFASKLIRGGPGGDSTAIIPDEVTLASIPRRGSGRTAERPESVNAQAPGSASSAKDDTVSDKEMVFP